LNTYLQKQECPAQDKRHSLQALLHEDAGDQPADCPKRQLIRIREAYWVWEGFLGVVFRVFEVW